MPLNIRSMRPSRERPGLRPLIAALSLVGALLAAAAGSAHAASALAVSQNDG